MPELEYTTSFGLKLTIEYNRQRAEPDVGLMASYCDEWYVVGIGSRVVGPNENIQWLYRKLRETTRKRYFSDLRVSEYDLIQETCDEAC